MSKSNRYLDKESEFRGRYAKDVFQTLYFSYRPVLGRISFLLVSGLIGRFLLLSNANLIGVWVDSYSLRSSDCAGSGSDSGAAAVDGLCRAIPSYFHGFEDLDFLQLLVAITLIGFVLTALFRIGFSRLSATAVSRLYDEVTLRTSRLPIQFFDTNPVGRVVTRFSSDYGNVFRLFGGPLAEFFSIAYDLLCMLILVTIASPLYLPIIIIIGFANYGVYRLNRERLRVERRELSAMRSPAISHFAETAQGASSIRIFGRQPSFLKRFSELNGRYLGQRIVTQKALFHFSLQMSGLTALLLLATGLVGYYLVQAGLASVGSLGVAFTFIVFSGNSMQMFFEWFAQFEEAMSGVERLNDYLRRPLEPGAMLPSAREFPTDHPTYTESQEQDLRREQLVYARSASVTVEDLWFRYSPNAPYVLKGIDFQIRPGEKVGIVGRTGSGKTSLVAALFHLYPFERGRILIDGREPTVGRPDQLTSSADLGLFRRSIALISQEPTLFRGSVRENLDLVGQHADGQLTDVLSRVGLSDWLSAQANGLESVIEERGRNLSAGERQLLCMARCLLQDAPVVVMDEATSSVDPHSEELLLRATRDFFSDRTQIIIAHRLSTLVHCDRVLWLHKGEVRMFDRPDKILPVFKSAELSKTGPPLWA